MNKGLDLLRFKSLVFKYWYVFVISVSIGIGAAYLINQYNVPSYNFSTMILLKNPAESGSEVSMLFETVPGTGGGLNLVNEVVLMRSVPLIANTLAELNFNISYFEQQRFVEIELYEDSPIRVVALEGDFVAWTSYNCQILDASRFLLSMAGESEELGKFRFGEPFKIGDKNYQIDLKADLEIEDYKDRVIRFQFNDFQHLVDTYVDAVQIQPLVSQSTIMEVSIQGAHVQKNLDFLDKLARKIVEMDIQEKNYNSERTIEFIEEQLAINGDSLSLIENQLQSFRNQNSGIDLGTEASTAFTNIQELEAQKSRYMLAMEYYEYLKKTFNAGDELEEIVVPSTFGVENGILDGMLNSLVSLQVEAKLFLDKGQSSKNPLFKEKIQKISELKLNILSHIRSLEETNQIATNDLNRRIAVFEKALQRLPAAERRLVSIQRKYTLSESIYTLLMQKKMEAGISKASKESKYKIINDAYLSGGPLGTSPKANYIIGLLLGFGIPLGIIYLSITLDTKIHTKEDILSMTDRPFLSAVPLDKGEPQDIFKDNVNKNTVLFEAFRMIRANLKFIVEDSGCKVVSLTSFTSGEGKSFSSKYLAYSLALSGEKVLLVDADLRKQKEEASASGKVRGLSNYLAGYGSLEEIIQTTANDNLCYIASGPIPPNPSELLMNARASKLMEDLKASFTYIIFDTAPVGLVSDAISLMKWSNMSIVVTRSGFTKIASVKELVDMNEKYHFPGFCFILNGDKHMVERYGSKGNAYYFDKDPEKKKAFKTLLYE